MSTYKNWSWPDSEEFEKAKEKLESAIDELEEAVRTVDSGTAKIAYELSEEFAGSTIISVDPYYIDDMDCVAKDDLEISASVNTELWSDNYKMPRASLLGVIKGLDDEEQKHAIDALRALINRVENDR
jgi:hypothetical protein